MQITDVTSLLAQTKYRIKCPFEMNPTYITIHNTANSASAMNEVEYMISNDKQVSCHVFVDDKEALLAIPLNRNAWHCQSSKGNRISIGVEICYSTDYKTNRHELSFMNAVEVVKQLMKQFNIPIDHVVQHNYWSGKDCPHRIRKEGTWEKFLSLCSEREVINMNTGYSKQVYSGITYHIYKQPTDLRLGMISVPTNPGVNLINNIDDSGRYHYSKMNGSRFNMATGEHYGVEVNRQFEAVPRQDGYLVFWIDKQQEPHWGKSSDFWLTRNDVEFAISPDSIMIWDSIHVNLGQGASGGQARLNTVANQSVLVRFKDKSYGFIVTSNPVSLINMEKYLNTLGITHAIAFDGGGSSQLQVGFDKPVYTGRKVSNCLTFYKWKEEQKPTEPVEEPKKECNCEAFKAENEQLKKENEALKDKLQRIDQITEEGK